MANHARLPLSGSHWTKDHLVAHRIRLEEALRLFGRSTGPTAPAVHFSPYALWDTRQPFPPDLDKGTRTFLSHLTTAADRNCPGETMIDMFAMHLLDLLQFNDEAFTALTIQPITPFTISGVRSDVNPDVVLWHNKSRIYLIIQEDKMITNPHSPVPQVICEAIAAFHHNNVRRVKLGRQPLDFMEFPCITMIGTRPQFLKVPVTKALSEAVMTGVYPQEETVVTFCSPPVPDSEVPGIPPNLQIGMDDVAYRQVCFEYYTAFRGIARECWMPFLDGIL